MIQLRKRSGFGISGPDLAGLEKFVREGDRTEPLHFAGREAEIQAVEGLLDSVKEGKAGRTRVITAAPGAGKTALLRQLEARWTKGGAARGLLLEAPLFSDPAAVAGRIFHAIDPEAAQRFGVVETETKARYGEGGVSAAVAQKGGGRSERSVQRTSLPVTFLDALGELQDRETPVVLLVDEAQMWGTDQEDGGRWISNLLVEAHMNLRRLPLLIVAAGLGDAPDAVALRGASKLVTEDTTVLGPLSSDEMGEVCATFFERFRIAGSREQRADWTRSIIAGTDGWPRHLTNALRGAAQSLIAGQGDLARSSLEAARAGGQGLRRKFYYDQTKPYQRMPELLAAVFSAMPGSIGAAGSRIEDAIDTAYEAHPKLHGRMARTRVFTALLHQGLIQDFGLDQYDCPIPSLRRYVEEFCAHNGCAIESAAAPPIAEPSGGLGG